MTINSYGTGAYRSARPNEFVSSRTQLDDLQRQLATKKKSETYGDLGIERRTSLDLNAKVSSIDSWLSGGQLADVSLSLSANAVQTFATMTTETKNDVRSNSYVPSASGRSAPQILAEEKFKQTLDLLNTDVNGRYLFSGRTTDIEPTASFSEIMDGDGAGRDGLKAVIAERKQADGVSPIAPAVTATGHLNTALAGTTTTVSRDAVDAGYGFQLNSPPATTTSAALAITATPAAPATPTSFSVDVTGQPLAGETLSFKLTLPDGTKEDVVLTARAPGSTGDPAKTFEIGTDVADTAAKLNASISAAISKETQTSLSAASTTVAATAFFAGSNSAPPKRIDLSDLTQPPSADPTGTVIWYRGDDASETTSPARSTSTVQIDKGQAVNIGGRANEEAFRVGLANFAVLSVETFDANDPNSQERYEALADRVRDGLGFGGSVQKPAEIITEFATAQTSIAQAKERHESTKSYLSTALDGVENVSTEEVAMKLLALQTQLQASYQTTANLSKLSLTNYL